MGILKDLLKTNSNTGSEKSANYAGYLFFTLLFFLLLKKTEFSYVPDLFYRYRFITFDGFQWVTDALHYLSPSVEVIQRNPGLPLVFAFLRAFFTEDLYPYLSALLIWFFYLVAYWMLLPFVKKSVALFTVFTFLFVFRIHSFFDYILADPWCLVLVMAAMGALFRIDQNHRFFVVFAAYLGLAFNFQFAPAFIAPAFAWRLWKTCDVSWINQHKLSVMFGCVLFLSLALPQFGYKWITFGTPFYSHVIHFPLLKFHFFGLPYYFVNFMAFLGYPIAFIVAIGWWKSLQERAPNIAFTHLAFIFNFSIWILIYAWLDTRFLLYLVPQWIIFFAFAAQKFELLSYFSIKKKGLPSFIVTVGLSIFSLNLASFKESGFEGASLPLTPQNVLRFSTDPISPPHTTYALSLQGLKLQNSDDETIRMPMFTYFRYYRKAQKESYQIPQGYIDESKKIAAILERNRVLPPTKLGACGDLGSTYEIQMRLFWTAGLNITACAKDSPWRVIRTSELAQIESLSEEFEISFQGEYISLLNKK